jgi:hypothetical protein
MHFQASAILYLYRGELADSYDSIINKARFDASVVSDAGSRVKAIFLRVVKPVVPSLA